MNKESSDEIFTNKWADGSFTKNFQMAIKKLRLQTLKDEKKRNIEERNYLKL